MATENKIDKEEIRNLGLKSLKNYLELDVSSVDIKNIGLVLQQAKLGLHFEKEMNLNTRACENNQIRIFVKMSAQDQKEFKDLVKRSALAKYLPK